MKNYVPQEFQTSNEEKLCYKGVQTSNEELQLIAMEFVGFPNRETSKTANINK